MRLPQVRERVAGIHRVAIRARLVLEPGDGPARARTGPRRSCPSMRTKGPGTTVHGMRLAKLSAVGTLARSASPGSSTRLEGPERAEEHLTVVLMMLDGLEPIFSRLVFDYAVLERRETVEACSHPFHSVGEVDS